MGLELSKQNLIFLLQTNLLTFTYKAISNKSRIAHTSKVGVYYTVSSTHSINVTRTWLTGVWNWTNRNRMWNLNLLCLSHSLSQVKPSPTNPELHTQVKLEFTTLSLEHTALTSQELDWHGSGTKHKDWRCEYIFFFTCFSYERFC